MNQAVANRLLRMDRTIEAVDGKLDEVLRLLRPIATPVPVIRYRGEEIPVDAQAVVVDRVLGALDPGRVVLPWAMGQHGAEVVAALSEFGYTPTPDASAGDAVRAALHAERRARDAANIDAGEARAEAGLRLRERDDAREDAAMWRSHTEFLARVFPGGPVEITRDGQCVTIANTPGRRRWWGRRRR